MVVVTSAIGRKNHRPSKKLQKASRSSQQLCAGISIRSQGNPNPLVFQADEIRALERPIKWSFQRRIDFRQLQCLVWSDHSSFVGLSCIDPLLRGLFRSGRKPTVGQIVTFITYLNMLVWPLQAMWASYLILVRGLASRMTEVRHFSRNTSNPKSKPSSQRTFKWRFEYDIKEFAYEKEPVLKR